MNIFLEAHNIGNPYSGLGQFNYHLIKALYEQRELSDSLEFTLNVGSKKPLKKEFGDYFNYNYYKSITRYPLFRVKKKFDLWHSLNQNTRIEPCYKMPYLTTIHDVNFMEEYNGKSLDKRKGLFNEKLNRSEALVYISEYAKLSTHNHFNVPNVPEYVIYNGNPVISSGEINIDNFKPKLDLKGADFIFTIGQVLKKKNFHTLVSMMQHLPEMKLVIAGKNNTSYAQEIITLIDKLKLKDRVFLAGKISDKEKNYYYSNCSAFVFPSLREGFGIPPIEAMSFGKPVFLSNKTSLPEIGGEDAFYWEHFDGEYMAQVFEKNIEHYNQNKLRYQKVYKERAASFNWGNAADEYLEVYKNICGL